MLWDPFRCRWGHAGTAAGFLQSRLVGPSIVVAQDHLHPSIAFSYRFTLSVVVAALARWLGSPVLLTREKGSEKCKSV